MAQTSCDFGEFLRRSLCAAAATIAVGDDGLDKIWIRLARARSSVVVDDREIAARGGARAGLVPVALLGCRETRSST
jgi:hypothetical protein